MILFINADPEFQSWRSEHKETGFIIGCDPWPNAGSEMKLHKASCYEVPKMKAGAFSKACSTDGKELVAWAKQEVKGKLTPCEHCNPLT